MNKLALTLTTLLLAISVTAYAADKVVVIPLNSSATSGATIYGGATIKADGDIQNPYGKPLTASKLKNGHYQILMPNYTAFSSGQKTWPQVFVSRRSSVGSIQGQSVVFMPATNVMDIRVITNDHANAYVDASFELMIYEIDTVSRSAASVAGNRIVGDCIFPPGSDATTCD